MDLKGLLSMFGADKQAPAQGMVQQAAQVLQSRPYQLHMQEAQANGQAPMTPEAFMQMLAQQQQQKPQGLLSQ